MALRVQLKNHTTIPLEVEGIHPEAVAGKSLGEIEKLEIYHGNRQVPLAEFFQVSGDPSDACVEWEGDLTGVHWIGTGMSQGTICILGSAGRHVGSRMRGGSIDVHGNVGDWVGGEMLGGRIRVHGNAGHMVGGAYRGSPRGMTGGTILVEGRAGNEIGHGMRRGLIAIGGDAGDLIGFSMLAGSIFVFGNCGIRHGAGMKRGTIGLLGNEPVVPLPTFRLACRCEPVILRLLDRTLRRHEFSPPNRFTDMPIELYNGDFLEGGRGEMLLRVSH